VTVARPDERVTEHAPTGRRTVIAIAAAIAMICAFFAVTSWTGLPGPGGARRYPVADLEHLADQINHSDDCGLPSGSKPVATVDWFRSRVHLAHPFSVALAPADRPMVDDPGPERIYPVAQSRIECIGMSRPG
jgi:hypothetical protein